MKLLKLQNNSPKFCKKEKNGQILLTQPSTVKISKTTPHRPPGPLPISVENVSFMIEITPES